MTEFSLPSSMSCIEISEPGGPDMLSPTERPVPEAGDDDVLIKVHTAGVNRPDVVQREGNYAPPPGVTDIPGLEVSGTIVAVGADVRSWSVGQDVCALVAGGGYAEYVAAPAEHVMPVPDGLSMAEAAALPETFMTVWTNVFDRAGLQPDETLLVHGGSSGIGTTAVQIASRLGARVMVTAGSDEKCRACLDLGAARAVNYHDEDFVSVAKDFGKGGVNVILDMVGGDYIQRNIKAAAPDARIVNIGFMRGSVEKVNFMPIMLKRLTLTGSTLRSQSVARKADIVRQLRSKVWPLIEAGQIRPVIFKSFDLAEAAEAHRLMESNAHIGKIMLSVASK